MTAYLIDTHILLWAWHRPDELSDPQRDILNSDANVFVSYATFWEIAVKVAVNKLQTVNDPMIAAAKEGYGALQIEPAHIRQVGALPHHHRDPFDRMLIAQAKAEGLAILTADRRFAPYEVEVV